MRGRGLLGEECKKTRGLVAGIRYKAVPWNCVSESPPGPISVQPPPATEASKGELC